MKIVVIGGTGLIGSKLVTKLGEHGHEAVPAAPNTGVNTLTGEGLAEALAGASVVIDVSNSPSFEDAAVLEFFETSTRNLLAAEAAAGVGHHVALSVVGTERLPESGYFRAKIAQEKLIENSSIPFSIVHATQFFEFARSIADAATDGGTVAARPRALPAHRGRRGRPGGRPDLGGVAVERAGSRSPGPSSSGWTSSSGTPWPLGAIRVRWPPTRTRATSEPSWASGLCCRAMARFSARSGTPTGRVGPSPASSAPAGPTSTHSRTEER